MPHGKIHLNEHCTHALIKSTHDTNLWMHQVGDVMPHGNIH